MKKRYLFFGFEKSGQSAFNLIYNKKDLFYIFDDCKEVREETQTNLKPFLNAFVVEKLEKKFIKNLSTIIISPGVSIYHWVIKFAKKSKIEVISELELGFRYLKKGKLVAITGTNGKTTTTRLVESILINAKLPAVACGNIGLPLTSAIKSAKKNTIFVCETSSFQLEAIKKFKPNIACILNITSDHINRHKSFFIYRRTKFKIAKNLDRHCALVLGENLKFSSKNKKYKKYIFNKKIGENCCYEEDGNIYFKSSNKQIIVMNKDDIKLKGNHNLQNVLCAITVCKLLKVKNNNIVDAVKNFKLSKHRLEEIFTHNKIKFYDDSKATNIDAAICAINSFENLTILILGGSDKGYDYDEIFKNIPTHIQHILCCGQVRDKLKNSAQKFNVKVEVFKNLKKATFRAIELASLYDQQVNVLLSPASASFDEFKNYKERGDKFLEYIKDFYEKSN